MLTHKLSADDPAQLFPAESPAYSELERAVTSAWNETQRMFGELRRRWFDAINLPDPTKDDDDAARPLTNAQRAAVNRAIAAFLREFAGEDRTREGFSASDTEDGLLQQVEFLSHAVGIGRARQLVPGAPNPAFTAGQRRRLLEDAFDRMSSEGRLRFETRLTEIRDAMVQMFNRGDNPLKIARELSGDLDGYERGRLRTIIRTESAIASEGAITGMLQAAGVQYVEILGDPGTDQACTRWFGQKLFITDQESKPPYHPNCYCSQVVWTGDE